MIIKKKDIDEISQLLNVNKIKNYKLISNSFNINCLKIKLENKKQYIVKFYAKKNKKFNAIESELKNLIFLRNKNLSFFPKIIIKNKNYLIIEFIDNDNKQPTLTNNDLLESIIKIHNIKNNSYGFDFNTQIGGLEKINSPQNNWADFYRDNRLYYIFNLLNKKNLIDKDMTKKIDVLLNKINLLIPSNPTPSLLHGDLWEGNILFDKKKFISFIDPGSFFGHNELEVAYLRWFKPKFIDKKFLIKYDYFINLHKDYLSYEPVYQLYYSLLNIYLWDKSYLENSRFLLNQIKL